MRRILRRRSSVAPVRVLESYGPPRPSTNPYVWQLSEAINASPDAELRYFSWRSAIVGPPYDVFHVHWPENLIAGHRRVSRGLRRTLFAMLCARLLLTRTPVVRTWHNLERPSGLPRVDHVLLSLLERLTRLRIRINDSGPVPGDTPVVTILHGHYRAWYAAMPRAEKVPGRMLFIGLVRRYKGVEDLIQAFRGCPDPAISLRVAGLPSTPELAQHLRGLAEGDDRITTQLEFLDDPEYVATVSAAELVVLPYRHMHNSGSVLAALSLDRPVLVPDNEVNQRLSDEVGPGWVHRYPAEIGAEDLERTVAALRSHPPTGSPDLGGREWPAAGAAHVEAFRALLTGPG